MRRALLILLLLFTASFAGCSFSMDYVVVNASGNIVNVTYTIGPTGIDPLAATGIGVPATLDLSELSGRKWRPLSSSQFSFDPISRNITVSLPPNKGLLIYKGAEWREHATVRTTFIITEIHITGSNGEMILKRDAVYKNFVVMPQPFYRFGPPTQATITYK